MTLRLNKETLHRLNVNEKCYINAAGALDDAKTAQCPQGEICKDCKTEADHVCCSACRCTATGKTKVIGCPDVKP